MKAKLTKIKYTPRKLRLVANMVKGMQVMPALEYLQNVDKKGAVYVTKTVKSAASNATNKGENLANLTIKEIRVDQSMKLKRFKAGSRHRVKPISRKFSTLTVVLN